MPARPKQFPQERESVTASSLGMSQQQKHLQQMYPIAKDHPFPVRVPAHPEDLNRDQALYHSPHYQYPHTLSFMGNFTPESEARMIQEFEAARPGIIRRIEKVPVTQSFSGVKQNNGADSKDRGWGTFAKDLWAMGMGWVAQQLELSPIERTTPEKSMAPPKMQYIDTTKQLKKPAPARLPISPYMPGTKAKAYPPSTRSPADKFGGPLVGFPNHDQNQKTSKGFITRHALSLGDGSDTEEENNDELEKQYFNKITNEEKTPIETVFGPGVRVWRPWGTADFAYEFEDDQDKEAALKKHMTKYDDELRKQGNVEYPVLPTIPEGTFRNTLSSTPNPTIKPKRPAVVHPLRTILPPKTTPTPAGYDPSYRPRTPNDTVFNRGSAGVDPEGAHNRPVKPLPNRRSVPNLRSTSRAHRIVSGSFGSFENQSPSRFEERTYQLPQGSAGAKRKQEEESKDGFLRGRPWLRRG